MFKSVYHFLRVFDDWNEVSLSGEWKVGSAGGNSCCFDTFSTNPQYLLTSTTTSNVCIVLSQHEKIIEDANTKEDTIADPEGGPKLLFSPLPFSIFKIVKFQFNSLWYIHNEHGWKSNS